MSSMTKRKALLLLGFEENAAPTRSDVRRAFRRRARECHPDKNPKASPLDFQKLSEALEILERRERESTTPYEDEYASSSKTREAKRRDFDPRAFEGYVDLPPGGNGHGLSVVWQCTKCDEKSSVCCRVKPRKHQCLCGHKLADHDPTKGFRCTRKGCPCARFDFHVQLNGWQVRCGKCKHKHTDHDPSPGRHRCLKCVGKYQKPCDCDGYEPSWVCNCGHSWKDHVTCFVSKTYGALARDWVCAGVSQEIRKEAEYKRKYAAERVAAKLDRLRVVDDDRLDTASFIRETILSMGLSTRAVDVAVQDVMDRRQGVVLRASGTTGAPANRTSAVANELRQSVLKKLKLIYKAYAPDKACKIPSLMSRFEGKEDRLLRKVMKKYRVSTMDTVMMSLKRKGLA